MGSFLIKPLNAAVCLGSLLGSGLWRCKRSIPSESRSLLQQDLLTESRAEKFAKVNCEGKQLAVEGGESTGEVPGEVPAFSGRPIPERPLWL